MAATTTAAATSRTRASHSQEASVTSKRVRSSSTAAAHPPLSQPPPPPTTLDANSSPTKKARSSPRSRLKLEQQPDAQDPPAQPASVQNSAGVKKEEDDGATSWSPRKPTTSEKKLASYRASIQGSPFPDHPLPTPEEAERVAWILGEHHGYKRESEGGRGLPQYTTPKGENRWGGCGDVASVLDALIRTVLSCNTSGRNSAAAHRSLTERFGRQNWQAILDADEAEVVDALRCGGLANNKTKTIRGILLETQQRHGVLSLDHLHQASDDEIMQELVSFNGVGPKVASCVLAFCIGRQSMAVDTHVFRLCKALGWVPEKANRDQTYYHLHERVPGHLKYALHVLLIKHGKTCDNCSAKGFATVKEEVKSSSSEEDERAEPAANDASEEKQAEVKQDIKKETADASLDAGKRRACPLKAAGLLGRRGKALKPKAVPEGEEEAKPSVKAEVTEPPSTRRKRTSVKAEVKQEAIESAAAATAGETAANALEKAQSLSLEELLKCLQKIRGMRSKNPLCDALKQKRYTLELATGSQLSTEQRKRVFAIFEDNMKSMYRNSSLGWKPTEKRRELFDTQSRFLILRPPAEAGAEIAAYIMWRFDTELVDEQDPLYPKRVEEGEEGAKLEISYLYEIQVAKPYQRKGIARELMTLLHHLTHHLGLAKTMLTVFHQNTVAAQFYRSMGYKVDLISPSKDEDSRVDYEILSKPAEPLS
ncbi:hypothetical protein ACQY0O_000378 [Thecaphora frezii]